MSKMVSARQLIGRTIVAFNPNPFDSGRGLAAHSPVITLDDGRRLEFVVEETEVGEYGVWIGISRKPRKPKGRGK